jgi:RimJ/RimL family protein N-acetyltransferase
MIYPEVKLRLFTASDAIYIAKWIIDEDYLTFFRYTSILPTLEECANYPAWSQNIVMMVMDENNNTIGMVNAYHVNYRNQTCKAGILIDKSVQAKGYGHAAYAKWINFLFDKMNFRKVIAEIVDEKWIEPLQKCGFEIEGKHLRECKLNGAYLDEYRLAVFKETWTGAERVK